MSDRLRGELGLIDLPGKDIYERYEELRLWADSALAELARLRGAQAWQPIETAPRDGTEVCAWVGSGYKGGWLQLSWYKVNGLAAWRDWGQDTWEPTHWMPIVEPTKFQQVPTSGE